MSATKAVLVGCLQLALVASVGGKFLWDRSTYPRAWARTAPVDPELPIRGRYVQLRIQPVVEPKNFLPVPEMTEDNRRFSFWGAQQTVRLRAENGRLIATPSEESTAVYAHARLRDGVVTAEIVDPLAYFIPEDATDPSIRPLGEELWVEVTIPPRGAPRPIRLAIVKNGVWRPLEEE